MFLFIDEILVLAIGLAVVSVVDVVVVYRTTVGSMVKRVDSADVLNVAAVVVCTAVDVNI